MIKDGKTLFSRQFRYFLIQIILYRTTVGVYYIPDMQIRYFIPLMTALFFSCTTVERNNPNDPGGIDYQGVPSYLPSSSSIAPRSSSSIAPSSSSVKLSSSSVRSSSSSATLVPYSSSSKASSSSRSNNTPSSSSVASSGDCGSTGDMCLWNTGGDCWPIYDATDRSRCASYAWIFQGGIDGEGTACSGGTFICGKDNNPPSGGATSIGCCHWETETKCWDVYTTLEKEDCSNGNNRFTSTRCPDKNGTCPASIR